MTAKVRNLSAMMNVNAACDYVIVKLNEASIGLNTLKLHKLLYYIQAWHLALHDGKRCFDGEFQAWVHGPVSREIYDRFKDRKSLYSPMTLDDVQNDFSLSNIKASKQKHCSAVLELYAEFADYQLEQMTHEEKPWIEAREGYRSSQRCEEVIPDEAMAKYYRARIKRQSR